MEFRVLGPVEVWSTGRRIDVGHAKQQSVLAVLLLDLGRVVPIDLLIDRVWGESPPASVRNNIYAYVARLRSAGVVITRQNGGYLLETDAGSVDLYRFRGQVAEASVAADPQAADLLSEALTLWRGPALAGLTSSWLCGMRDSLERQRIAALLDLGEIALRQGEHTTLGGLLATEAVAHPTDERLIGQLMLALYRSGRQAEALRWYEQTRRHLADELGADPEPALARLHQQILRSDLELAPPARPAARPGPMSAPVRPRRRGRMIVAAAVVLACAALIVAGVTLGLTLMNSGSSPAASTTAISGHPPPVSTGPVCEGFRGVVPPGQHRGGQHRGSSATARVRPDLCVSQARGSPFTVFTVRDSGFEPGTDVTLSLVFAPPPPPSPFGPPPPRTLRTLSVDANGAVRLGRFPLGVYTVVVSGPGTRQLVAVFQVIPPAVG